jgi:hypothetical protein
MDLSFNTREHLKAEGALSHFLAAADHLNHCRFSACHEELALIPAEDIIEKAIVSHKANKAFYEAGEFLKAYKGSQDLVELLKKAHEAEEDEGRKADLNYWLLKVQTSVAKVLNKIKDTVKAEDVCDDVLAMCEAVPVTRQHKFALKALYMKTKNMLNIMEFRKAKELLEDQAKPILKDLN